MHIISRSLFVSHFRLFGSIFGLGSLVFFSCVSGSKNRASSIAIVHEKFPPEKISPKRFGHRFATFRAASVQKFIKFESANSAHFGVCANQKLAKSFSSSECNGVGQCKSLASARIRHSKIRHTHTHTKVPYCETHRSSTFFSAHTRKTFFLRRAAFSSARTSTNVKQLFVRAHVDERTAAFRPRARRSSVRQLSSAIKHRNRPQRARAHEVGFRRQIVAFGDRRLA